MIVIYMVGVQMLRSSAVEVGRGRSGLATAE